MTQDIGNAATGDRDPADLDALDTYRRMFADAYDGLSAWWYLGTSFVDVAGFATVPVLHIETLMIYKTQTLSADSFRMDWWEIGYMRDPTTGEIAKTWTNPITGEILPTPQTFEEGPAHFIITRDDAGLDIQLVQPHARIQSVSVDFTQDSGRVRLEQVERKIRGFPLPDGSMPSLDSENVSQARTRLSILSSRADLRAPDAPCSGSYDFELTAPPWMGLGHRPGRCVVRGIMVKSKMNDKLNPTAWARLQALFPDCFDGDVVRPRWS